MSKPSCYCAAHPNADYFASRGGKVKRTYSSKSEADEAARTYRQVSYRCRYCRRWHVRSRWAGNG